MKEFKKVILWGYRLYSHTNSYVYSGFYNAFKSMGYDTRWYFDEEDHAGEDFENCLFFSFSGQDDNMPLNKSSKYLLHNPHIDRFDEAGCSVTLVQTLHNEAINRCGDASKINDYTLVGSDGGRTLVFTPWATNLLPDEFDFDLPSYRRRRCIWIGTHGDFEGIYQNGQQLQPFFDACSGINMELKVVDPWKNPVSFKKNYKLVRSSMIAPALQGKWQVDNDYPACRIFKNISYGNMGVTNCRKANELFDCELVYDEDTTILFHKSVSELGETNRNNKIKSLMRLVQDKHTYVSRINTLLKFI